MADPPGQLSCSMQDPLGAWILLASDSEHALQQVSNGRQAQEAEREDRPGMLSTTEAVLPVGTLDLVLEADRMAAFRASVRQLQLQLLQWSHHALSSSGAL